MKTIYKYQLQTIGYQEIQIPVDAEILSIEMQYDIICIWAIVDPGNISITRKFYIFGTGQWIEDELLKHCTHLRSLLTRTHNFVWHVFEWK